MVGEDDQLGVSTLRLLAERLTVRVLRELTAGPLQPSELELRLPGAAHSAVMRGLGELVLARAVARKRISVVPPRAYYELTGAGSALLAIAGAAECWERRWASLARADVPGAWTLRLLADDGNRALLRGLAGDPLRPIDLDGRISHLCRSATRRRLGHLLASGLLSRTHIDGAVCYESTAAARQLGPIATLAARWEWQWSHTAPQFAKPRAVHAPPHAVPALDFDA